MNTRKLNCTAQFRFRSKGEVVSEKSFASNGKENSSETGVPHETLTLKMVTKKPCGFMPCLKKK